MKAGELFRFLGIADIHYWMIISDPQIDPDKVLLVSFTSFDRFNDQACVLNVGDHPVIVHKTTVEYPRAKVTTDSALESLRSAGRLDFFAPLEPQLLTKIRNGAMTSTRIQIEVAQILIDQGLVKDI